MNDKDKKEFFEKWLKIGVDPQLVWEWIESKKEEWGKQAFENGHEDGFIDGWRLATEFHGLTYNPQTRRMAQDKYLKSLDND